MATSAEETPQTLAPFPRNPERQLAISARAAPRPGPVNAAQAPGGGAARPGLSLGPGFELVETVIAGLIFTIGALALAF